MEAFELPARTVDEALRLVRALGTHRYVAARMHLVHAFVYAAVGEAGSFPSLLEPAVAWARDVLEAPNVDPGSRDERLVRSATEEELSLTLEAFWRPSGRSDAAHDSLMERLRLTGIDLPSHEPFDERAEDEVFPRLIDAGWELHPLKALDPERHKGARGAFGEPFDFEVACFEEESALEPPAYVQELSLLGPVELLRGVDADGALIEPLVLWTEGPLAYHDYVVRGVLRAARLG